MEEKEQNFKNDPQSLMKIEEEERRLKEYQTYLYMFNGKPDSISKIFTKPVVVKIEDIHFLNERITKKIKNHYDDKVFATSVHVSFQNKESKDFGTWDGFKVHNWYESEKITNIVITWEFFVKLPIYENPQRHKLIVKMSSSMKPEEMLNLILTGNIEDMDEIEQEFFPIVTRVDFIDRDLGDELINIVKSWVDGLVKNFGNENSKSMTFFKKHKRIVALLINNFFTFVLLFLGVFLFNISLGNLDVVFIGAMSVEKFKVLFNLLFIYCFVIFTSNWISKQLARSIYAKLSEMGDVHIFNITKGDINEQKRLENKDKDNKKGIIGRAVFNVILNIGCGLLVTWICCLF
ncbi:Uncharacterised protein [Acetobacterium wieringae]|uniref:hypothetical protein n=1 Tax=Acetobacterium wieringae TaxID=52694 RepID=UPI001D650103|nr:hypothetical protein [Acetobacterium wieringae]VUZ28551.1 Uncharacterised protein [Acetobacterium wieringae]